MGLQSWVKTSLHLIVHPNATALITSILVNGQCGHIHQSIKYCERYLGRFSSGGQLYSYEETRERILLESADNAVNLYATLHMWPHEALHTVSPSFSSRAFYSTSESR